jgi:endonuclease/exonuclease/phosphatase family metal-dependent hydrolase
LKSIDLLKERTGSYSEDFPLILTGDFNFNPHTVPYKYLNEFFRDSYTEDQDSLGTTNHEWNGRTEALAGKSNRIDYIWNRGKLQVKACRILIDNPSTKPGVYPSDHWPVLCDIQLPRL